MRFDLKKPCLNCPFRADETRIRFADRERAEDIEEQAYRRGFPCHKTATIDDDDEDGGYEFSSNGKSQHCIGAIMMWISEGTDSTPGTNNDDDLFSRISERVDWNVPVFQNTEDFFDANTKDTPNA
jgi:hypothetical protein